MTLAALSAVAWLAIAMLYPGDAGACGWGDEGWYDDEIEEVEVGADGKPLPEEDVEPGDPAGQTALGNRYRTGDGLAVDYGLALRWYRRAAEQGYAAAQNNLGAMYENGLGVARDDPEAAKWYRRAAVQGDIPAQHSLGQMLLDGRGVSADPALGAEWIRKAAEGGHASAFVDLGTLYWDGRGTGRDDVQALMWWTLAATQKQEQAAELRDMATAGMTPDRIAEAEQLAREWKPRLP
jgi:TPR repeat protein